MDPMNGHFSPINGLESVNGIQFLLCGTPRNLIFAHRVLSCGQIEHIEINYDTRINAVRPHTGRPLSVW